ncbi:hypothetical protein LZ32DRAFT_664414 [Colletotrichum eremochloae]|nr:hypothetical protein LZ32DRAFT_664414 [Colletotrichum eremochloae]
MTGTSYAKPLLQYSPGLEIFANVEAQPTALQEHDDDEDDCHDPGDDSRTEIQAPSTAAKEPSFLHNAPALVHELAEASSTPLSHLHDLSTTTTWCQQTPPPAKAPEKPADRGRMDPSTRTRLLKACTDILQIVGPSSFTNQSALDPLERRLQGLVRCAAFAVQAAAAGE